MFRTLMRQVVSLVSGNVDYSPPPAPVRGYDAVTRLALANMPLLMGSAGGTGEAHGQYGRTAPYFYNAQPAVVTVDIHGAATGIKSNMSAGVLIDPNAGN